ncbi:Deoxyribodipyrimidine photo-lyase [Stanieria cyanosphaera PCC 7437]|uniref:Deoxyribodipyrimidine photo-lyase n=1 Tax=Stanieria cyanosphaera (strain ATCC 29371 / PCC 7437) TaxID=111780 RepID=K9XYL7_STAC7|nr:FAD-binding domain-containing protein [Stanieria cyanosphaera]AFZ37695.1 Deoxyribodipyrimidine photo-lyase [Stanieria cyanosphaera PCC 7437]
MSSLILFWHRRDLRLTDNVGLAAARQQSSKIVGVFCLDENLLTKDDVAPARVTYMIGCLQQLQQSYQQAGSQLLIIKGKPTQTIPQLAETLQAKTVFWNWDVEPYAKARDQKVKAALTEKGIEVSSLWDQLLHAPGEILTKSSQQPYTVYTPFWKNWIEQKKQNAITKLNQFENLTDEEFNQAQQSGVINLPTAKDLGYIWDNPLILAPGETAAKERLVEFCSRAINEYDEQRNYPAVDGTSQLSAALKFGAIGIRTVWEASTEAHENCRSDETRDNIRSWQQELAWREFYQHCMYFFPELEQGAYRREFKDFPWENNEDYFQAWCEGKTGYPIVDAAMRQLNEIGWMHNRCRMIVASFLTKDLIINWQWGEKYFMQKLFDGDLSANNGGWQWSASSGMDPKPLRIFNPASQAQKYDPEGEYIRQWLPELSSVDNEYLVTGKISKSERERCDYPQPIVDHKIQQRKFKELYQSQK